MVKKLLVVGIILLLVGMSIPSTGENTFNYYNKTNFQDSIIIVIKGKYGNNGWWVSPVTVIINTSDVDEFWYSLNNGPWTLYTEPFIIDEEGKNILDYKWKTYEGDWYFATVPEHIAIDYSNPLLEVHLKEKWFFYFVKKLFRLDGNTNLVLGKLTITANVEDIVSGVHNVSFSLVKEDETSEIYVLFEQPFLWELTGRHIGDYTLTVTAYDYAGLFTNKTVDIKLFQLGIL